MKLPGCEAWHDGRRVRKESIHLPRLDRSALPADHVGFCNSCVYPTNGGVKGSVQQSKCHCLHRTFYCLAALSTDSPRSNIEEKYEKKRKSS